MSRLLKPYLDTIQKTLQSSLDKVQLPKLKLDQLGGQFEKLLKDADLGAIAAAPQHKKDVLNQ